MRLAAFIVVGVLLATFGPDDASLPAGQEARSSGEQQVPPADTARWRQAFQVLARSTYIYEGDRCFLQPPGLSRSEFECGILFVGTTEPPTPVIERLARKLSATILRVDSMHTSVAKLRVPARSERQSLITAFHDPAIVLVGLNHYGAVGFSRF
ncbi:MAG: hypothetical protein P8099_17255 [Gemmatimonadota bacterium]|jgi:hypothetical protein